MIRLALSHGPPIFRCAIAVFVVFLRSGLRENRRPSVAEFLTAAWRSRCITACAGPRSSPQKRVSSGRLAKRASPRRCARTWYGARNRSARRKAGRFRNRNRRAGSASRPLEPLPLVPVKAFTVADSAPIHGVLSLPRRQPAHGTRRWIGSGSRVVRRFRA